MATQKFSELTTTATPNSASVFAIAYSGTSYGVTLANIAANLPATTVTSLTSSGNITVSGDLTISGDDLFMNTNTSGAALIGDGTNFNPVVISGDIAIAAGGAATIQADAVEGSMLNDNVISGQTEITSGLADADELLYSDAGTLKRVGMDTAKSYFHSSTATAFTVADESSDTTCFPVFVTAATGDLAPKSGSNLAFNSSSGLLTATGFSGPLTGNVTGNASGSSGSCTGLAATATALASARTIGGVSFDGTGNINLPGVNTAGNQATSGLAATATLAATTTALASARNIGGVSFDGTGNIDLPGVNASGNQNTSGTAAIATTVTVADESSDTTCFPLFATAATGDLAPKSGSNLSFNSATGALTATSFVGTAPTPTVITIADESSDTTCFPLFVTAATGDLGPKSAAGLTFNSSSDTLTATAFSGPLTGNVTGNASGSSGSCTGNSATATSAATLTTARNIGGVSFNGSGNIDLPGVNAAGSQNTSGTAAGLSATLATGSGGTGLTGAVVGKQTIWIPAAAMYPNTTAGCAALAQVELSNGPELKCLDFDTSSDENAQFTVAFPKLWALGTVTFQAFWTVTGTNTGTVAWGLSGVAFASDGDQNTAFGTNVVATALAHSGTSNDLMVSAESGAVTIAGSPGDNELCYFQIMRDVSADDQSGDARLLGIKLFFTTDALTDA
jgi:hypothetical protein